MLDKLVNVTHAVDCVTRPDASDFGCTELFTASLGGSTNGQEGQHSSVIDHGENLV